MADISKIKLPSGTTYDLKDAKAREDIASLQLSATGGMRYIGVTTTALSNGVTTNPISISGTDVTALSGDIAIYGESEFIFSTTDNKWHEFGSTGSLKGLAFKDSASGEYAPSGTLSGGTVTVELNTADKYVASSATSGGSVTAGSAASCTLPTFSTSVQDETLTFSWTTGSFSANTPTAVTLPTFTSAAVATGVKSAAITTEPTFTGDSSTVTVS